jgi:hypothetical protein
MSEVPLYARYEKKAKKGLDEAVDPQPSTLNPQP